MPCPTCGSELAATADPAALAAEPARLARELADAREQQAAMGEILRVISSSPADVSPVFSIIAKNAVRLCNARFGAVYSYDGTLLHFVAGHGLTHEARQLVQHQYPIPPRGLNLQASMERGVVHAVDVLEDRRAANLELARTLGYRSNLVVPMLRANRVLGTINVFGVEPKPFSEVPNRPASDIRRPGGDRDRERAVVRDRAGQIALLQIFADQAVIAINNVRLFQEVQARTRELTEALEHQSATSEVLGVISRSPNELQPVLDAIVQTAATLCTAESAFITRFSDNQFVLAAANRVDAEHIRYIAQHPISIGRGSITGRVALDRRVIHVADVLADPEFDHHEWQTVGRQRTVLGVPLLLERSLIGVMILYRTEVAPFTEKQIELVETFADQAVIAIENARLFEEVQARTREVTEALEYQTATSEVLNVISRSPNELQPVFDTIVATSKRLCSAELANLWRLRNGRFELAAHTDTNAERVNFLLQNPIPVGRGSLAGRSAVERRTLHMADIAADPELGRQEQVISGNLHTMAVVPLIQRGEPIGVISLARTEVRSFTDKQIDLVTTFADQAVIAIENARLFEAEQARTNELQEALEYQTATSAVLGVIARSPNELQPVLDSIVETAARLCQSDFAFIFKLAAGNFHLAAISNAAPDFIEFLRDHPIPPGRGTTTGRAALERRTIHIPDVLADPEYTWPEMVKRGNYRTNLGVPLLRDGIAVGVIVLVHSTVKPFTEKQIELVTSFANQAVIAIENARLFEEVQARTRELQEALDYQTATSEVLGVISRSPNELQPVLDAIVGTALNLCQAQYALISKRGADGRFHLAASANADSEFLEWLRTHPITAGDGSAVGIVAVEKHTIHLHDALADPRFTDLERQRHSKARTMLAVPLMRADDASGVIFLARNEVRPFTTRQVDLVTTFADQAVIAIENTRLFEAEQERSKELQEALEYQTATSEVLGVISRSPSQVQPVLDTIVAIGARLCEAEFSILFNVVGNECRLAASNNVNSEFTRWLADHPVPFGPGSTSGRAALERRTIHVLDVLEEPTGKDRLEARRRGGQRTCLSVPLLREGAPLGVITMMRSEVRSFTERQVALVETFADQAVIAIENARLFEEVQARTRELQESLEYQTATPRCWVSFPVRPRRSGPFSKP